MDKEIDAIHDMVTLLGQQFHKLNQTLSDLQNKIAMNPSPSNGGDGHA